MSRIANKLISYLLLLCISATVVPLNLLHHHEEETHCDESNAELEKDLCHISSYHPNDILKEHCEHDIHFNEEHSHCEFCKFITTQRDRYTFGKQYSPVPARPLQALIAFESSFFHSSVLSVVFSRGPPA